MCLQHDSSAKEERLFVLYITESIKLVFQNNSLLRYTRHQSSSIFKAAPTKRKVYNLQLCSVRNSPSALKQYKRSLRNLNLHHSVTFLFTKTKAGNTFTEKPPNTWELISLNNPVWNTISKPTTLCTWNTQNAWGISYMYNFTAVWVLHRQKLCCIILLRRILKVMLNLNENYFFIFVLEIYSGAKKYLVSHQLCKFSHLKRWERPVIFIIGIPQLWETK